MKAKFLITAFFTVILLSACGTSAPASPTPDVNAIYTAAAQTVVAELTQTAAVITPTIENTATETQAIPTETTVPAETPLPTETETLQPTETLIVEVTPTDQSCDDSSWVADVSVPDGTEMSPGQEFIKTWKIKNTGTCIWGAGYGLGFGFGHEMNGQALALSASVAPGEEVEVSVQFKAPVEAGEYSSTWRMSNGAGVYFGESIYVLIVVR
ncbi:MAG: hypothetical protein B5M51_06905 [Anaerolinea sp. 4484_236]|nr:MAG: hypothetical protein B5M51_06905 [Anaerolinea sp. 4484_236]OQY35898.1 MAG: hypothetical protein B6243_04170 [Anaerolineaceae bacterium 4572_5.2]